MGYLKGCISCEVDALAIVLFDQKCTFSGGVEYESDWTTLDKEMVNVEWCG